jgi:hypothetical protein
MFDSSACNPRRGSAYEGEKTTCERKEHCKACMECKACKEKAECKHHKKHPKGEAFAGEQCGPVCEGRQSFFGQLEPTPALEPVGQARVDVKTGVTSVSYRIDVGNVENITGAYIHLGESNGRLGPVVATLYKGEPRSGSFRESLAAGTITTDKLMGPMQGKDMSTFADEIRRGNAFVRITTTEKPEGILIGRIDMNQPPADTRDRFMGETPANRTNQPNQLNQPSEKLPADIHPPMEKQQPAEKNPSDLSMMTPAVSLHGARIVLVADEPGAVKDLKSDAARMHEDAAKMHEEARKELSKNLFKGEEHGQLFTAVLTPPRDEPGARATFVIAANKDSSDLRYHLTLRDVRDPKGANLYLIENPEKARAGEKDIHERAADGKPALERAEKAVEKAGEKTKEAAHETGEALHRAVHGEHRIVEKLGEPIAKLTLKGDIKAGVFNGVFAEGTLTKADLMGAMKGQDVSALIDHIRQGKVYVAVITEKDPTGKFQGVVHMRPEKSEKDHGAGFKGDLPAKPVD